MNLNIYIVAECMVIVGHDWASELDECDETAPGAADAEAVAAED